MSSLLTTGVQDAEDKIDGSISENEDNENNEDTDRNAFL